MLLKPPPAEVPTDRRITHAVSMIANEFDFPRKVSLRTQLAHQHDPVKMGRIGEYYRQQAWVVLKQHLDEAYAYNNGDNADELAYAEEVKKWPLWFGDAVTIASGYAYQIRVAAQGVTGLPPDPRVWSALVGALSLLTVRARIGDPDHQDLSTYVASLVRAIEGL